MLIYCTQLQFSTNDSLPQQICPDCLTLLEGAFTFWKQCRQTDDNFRLGLTTPTTRVVKIPAIPEEDDPVDAEELEPTEALVGFHCCLPKCSKVAGSLVELEEHAKQDHWLKRRGFELRRKRNHVHVCSVCLEGFASLGGWEDHQLVLQGLGGERESEKDPGEEGESSDSDEWPEQEAAEGSFEQREMEVDVGDINAGKRGRKSNPMTGGQMLFCNGCGYQSNKKYNMSRHQHVWGHEGVTSSVSEISSEAPPVEQPASAANAASIQFVEVPVKLEPPPNDPDGMATEEVVEDEKISQQCAYCGMFFYTKAQKLRHLQFTCTALYKPKKSNHKQCPDCNKKFNSKHGLARHAVYCTMGAHEKPRSCPNCERVFNKNSNLKRHISLQNCSKKKFQCEHCRASYSKMSALTRHLNNGCMEQPSDDGDNDEERPLQPPPARQQSSGSGRHFECPHCFSRFSRRGNLNRHINESCHVMPNKKQKKKKAATETETAAEQDEQKAEQPEVDEAEEEEEEELVTPEQEVMKTDAELFTET